VDFGSRSRNIIIAMIVATIKVGFVGAVFMHLKGEKKTIWRPLFFTAFFVAGLFLLTLLHWYDPIFSTAHNEH
jgi:heme/copper-type cytochrome/quinol oxidase subunit 4